MQLSFLIPAYNVEKYIDRCLDSIIKQPHFDEYELIIRNDGSTDNTLNIINKYAQKYKNIKVLTGENVGTLKCRELLVKEANSEYCWFIDSDDEITDNAIESILKTCDDWKIDFDCMCFNWSGCKQHRSYVNFLKKYNNKVLELNDKEKKKLISHRTIAVVLWAKIVKTKIYKKCLSNINFKICFTEDILVWCGIVGMIKKYIFCNKNLYHYIYYENSISNKKELIELSNDLLLFFKAFAKFGKEYKNTKIHLLNHFKKRIKTKVLIKDIKKYIFIKNQT